MLKKDWIVVSVCAAAGLAIAFLASGPLRKSPETAPLVGTPMKARTSAVYARGTIDLSAALKQKNTTGRVLFLIVRSTAGGAPVAVKKFTGMSFPLSFEIGPEDNMVGEDYFEGDITVTARLDADGAAGPKSPDDREGAAPIKSGSDRRVRITIE
jgi:hypothetical protein